MRMMFVLPTLLLAFVPIKSSSPQSPSFNEGWFPVLKYSHNTACIPKNSKCALQDQIRFPRDIRKRFQERHKRGIFGPKRYTRGIFDPLPVQRNPGFCCGYCSCETDCFKYGSCCLWMYESLSHARKESSGSKYGCVNPELLYGNRTKPVKPIWMITKCDSEIQNQTLKELCENQNTDESILSLIPVTVGTLTYRNRFCALCNGVSDLDMLLYSWKVEFQCMTILKLPDDNLLQTIKEKQCNIHYIKPVLVKVDECKIVPYVTSECNVTGKWEQYDPLIEAGCHAFIDPFNLTYANVFCYLCNTERAEQSEPMMCKLPANDYLSDVTPPFVAILTLDAIISMTTVDTLDCDNNSQFKDEKMMICRDILCAEERELVDNACRIRPSQSDSSCYYMLIKMTYVGEVDLLQDKVVEDTLIDNLEFRLADLIPEFYDEAIKMDIFIKRNVMSHNQSLEYIILRILIEPNNVEGHDIQNATIHSIHEKEIDINSDKFVAELVLYNITTQGDGIFITVPNQNRASPDILLLSKTKMVGNKSDTICSIENVMPFKKVDMCPHVKATFDEMAFVLKDDGLHGPGDVTLSSWEYAILGKDILICLDAFEIMYEKIAKLAARNDQSKATKTDKVHPKHLLSLVCVCLSMTCLLITIAIISTFSELHSQPGINNIMLCTCLLLTQAFYQFGAGQSSLKSWACALIGGICHFLWLSVLFSMNACCIQMFRIFTSRTKLKSRFELKLTLKYLTYIIGSSLCFVIVNLGVSLGTSNGMASGYGGNLCYITSPMMHLYTFVIPFALAIIVNLGLFGFVILKINQSRIASRELHGERSYFGAYVRLSTLTGLTWIFGYLYVFLKDETLEYLFIICNASQGVFIMVAFIVNRRVFNLVRKRSGIQKTESTNDG